MLEYILKSSACLAVFLLIYKLLLEKESMHVFKRFYLLASLLVSFGIPFITFTKYIEVPLDINNTVINNASLTPLNSVEASVNYVPYILWSIYLIGVFIFSLKFIFNLSSILLKIKQNPKLKTKKSTNVLLEELIVPHTFLSFIFLNKARYENQLIPKEVLIHEEVHAVQKHSLDILFIELFQIMLWFNPLIYMLKKTVKLNHEFLADLEVIKQGVTLSKYQQILLAFSSNALEPQLATAINYSFIKKRFTVMKTQTSKKRIWLRSMVLLPLLAVLIYSFSSKKTVEKYIASETSGINYTARSIDIKIFENGTYKIDGIPATKETFISVINLLHQDITPEIRNNIINVHVNDGKIVSDEDVWFIYNSVVDYGFHRIVTYNQEIIREKGNKPYAITNPENQKGASKEQMAEYNKLAKYYNSVKGKDYAIKLTDMKRIKYLYSLMTDKQKASAEPFPNFPPPPPSSKTKDTKMARETAQPTAYRYEEELKKRALIERESKKEYRELERQVAIKEKEAKMLEREAKMNERDARMLERDAILAEQKKEKEYVMRTRQSTRMESSELTPPPPPPIPVNATPEEKVKYQKTIKEYNEKHSNMVKKGEESNIPPPPPPPKAPLDFVIDMAKKDATFYFGGEQITSGEAISMLKENKSLNISAKNSSSKNPKIYISKEPITID